MPKLSVLMPTYNYGQYIEQAINSLLKQDFSDIEIIISDDCSTDNSTDVIEKLAKTNEKIRPFFQKSNLGMVANWNWCLEKAKGDYIMYLFADDFLRNTNALSKLIYPLTIDERVSASASARMIVDKYGAAMFVARDLRKPGVYSGEEVVRRCCEQVCNLVGEPSAVMFRKSAAVRGFDTTYRQLVDLEMWLHLASQGKFYFTDEPLIAFRKHEQQQTAQNASNPLTQTEMIRIVQEYLPKPRSFRQKAVFASICYELMYNAKKSPATLLSAEPFLDFLKSGAALMPILATATIFRIRKIIRSLTVSYEKRINTIKYR